MAFSCWRGCVRRCSRATCPTDQYLSIRDGGYYFGFSNDLWTNRRICCTVSSVIQPLNLYSR